MELLSAALVLPILGTALGAGGVFIKGIDFTRSKPYLLSLSAGIMLASSFWSLLIPAFENGMTKDLSILPFTGLWLGVIFIIAVEKLTAVCMSKGQCKSISFMTAVIIHNIPEGIAVGVAAASAFFSGSAQLGTAALSLALGIALQNVPEGAVISLPLFFGGKSKGKSFIYGVLSGISEPIFAIISIFFSSVLTGFLPFLLGFAAGAMIYVTIFGILSEIHENGDFNVLSAAIFFVGFTVMTVADKLV